METVEGRAAEPSPRRALKKKGEDVRIKKIKREEKKRIAGESQRGCVTRRLRERISKKGTKVRAAMKNQRADWSGAERASLFVEQGQNGGQKHRALRAGRNQFMETLEPQDGTRAEKRTLTCRTQVVMQPRKGAVSHHEKRVKVGRNWPTACEKKKKEKKRRRGKDREKHSIL